MYLLRLDDASEYMDVEKWDKIEELLDQYDIKPIVGIIPDNQDESLVSIYQKDFNFWDKVKIWDSKGWALALHGCTHVHSSNSGGINPVNYRSEFAGVSLNEQRKKIRCGVQVFHAHQLKPEIFFAPSHTFDINTLKALEIESDIRVVSDTIANDIYKVHGFYFIPQQSGRVRNLPFKVSTFCYHPNTMDENSFRQLETFIKNNKKKIYSFNGLSFKDRNFGLYDKALKGLYFTIRDIRKRLKGK